MRPPGGDREHNLTRHAVFRLSELFARFLKDAGISSPSLTAHTDTGSFLRKLIAPLVCYNQTRTLRQDSVATRTPEQTRDGSVVSPNASTNPGRSISSPSSSITGKRNKGELRRRSTSYKSFR